MDRLVVARPLRLLLVACFVAAVFTIVIGGLGAVLDLGEAAVLLPFAAAAVTVAGLGAAMGVVDRMLRWVAHDPRVTPYSVLAETAARTRSGSLEQALPGLAQVIGEGTGARQAVLWLAVEDRLAAAAAYPSSEADVGLLAVPNLADLWARPDTDHVMPVFDGPVLRAALTIGKAGRPVTPADQRLMRDVANGAGMLLRDVQLNAELEERVRRADELAEELGASQQRLTQARDVERRRLVTELGNATTDRLAALRAELANARHALSGAITVDPDAQKVARLDAEEARQALHRARVELDELLERFRVIARGVYPSVLRDQGPYGALDELATDMPRPVRLSGILPGRLAWEVESGIYYLAASAIRLLAGQPREHLVRVHLEHADGCLSVRIDDPYPPISMENLRVGLSDDVERLAALGGDLALVEDDDGGAVLRAWLPDQLEPTVVRPNWPPRDRSVEVGPPRQLTDA